MCILDFKIILNFWEMFGKKLSVDFTQATYIGESASKVQYKEWIQQQEWQVHRASYIAQVVSEKLLAFTYNVSVFEV